MKIKRQTLLAARAVCLILMLCTGSFAADTLYTLNVTGELLSVDPTTGSTTQVAAAIGAGSWNGLTASPVDSTVMFTINNPRPPTLDDPQFSRLVRINLDDGESTLFPLFNNQLLGSPGMFSSGIAVSPQEPNVAIISGSDSELPPQPYLFRVDIATGEVLEPAIPMVNVRRIEALTFGMDGTTLYGTNQDGELVTIDPQTATATDVGDPQLTNFLTGLVFEPNVGTLFAIDALRNDRLVSLDASTGTLKDNIGALGITGPEGLAFAATVPEPCGLTMVAMALAASLLRVRPPRRQRRI